jgi:hypothetical protein
LSILCVTPRALEREELSRPFHKGQAVILNEDERILRLFLRLGSTILRFAGRFPCHIRGSLAEDR